jgi:hypothetical protein
MPDEKKNLFLYEAIELRAEYDARIKTLKGLLPESRPNRDRLIFHRDDEMRTRPVRGFDLGQCREEMSILNAKRRKLNSAIQRANFDNRVMVAGQEVAIAEALELRKALNERIGELSSHLAASAYERVVHKENRDIVEGPDQEYLEVKHELDEARQQFRELNRKLRAAAYTVAVDYKDEV